MPTTQEASGESDKGDMQSEYPPTTPAVRPNSDPGIEAVESVGARLDPDTPGSILGS